MVDLALFILRVVLGLIIAAHGAQKLFGWFGGPGPSGFAGMMERMNLRPGWLWGAAAGLAEFGGGLLLVLGLFTPVGAALVIGAMLMAIATVHLAKGFWNTKGGFEFNLLIIAVAFALGLAGPGAWSLDAYVAGVPRLDLFSTSLVVVLLGVAAGLLAQEWQAARAARTR